MAQTNFNGPINSVEGFQTNGNGLTWACTRITTSQIVEASIIKLASVAGLSTVEWGIAKHNSLVHGATILYAPVHTSKSEACGSGSFQLTLLTSGDATVSAIAGSAKFTKAATIDVLLFGAG